MLVFLKALFFSAVLPMVVAQVGLNFFNNGNHSFEWWITVGLSVGFGAYIVWKENK